MLKSISVQIKFLYWIWVLRFQWILSSIYLYFQRAIQYILFYLDKESQDQQGRIEGTFHVLECDDYKCNLSFVWT